MNPWQKAVIFLAGSLVGGLAIAFLAVAWRPELLADRLAARQAAAAAAAAGTAPPAGVAAAPGAAQTTADADGTPPASPVRQVPLGSYAESVRKAAPAVVNVYAARIVTERLPRNLLQDPFGELGPRYRQRLEQSLGSGVIVDPAGQRAFGSAVVLDGQVVAIDVVFAVTNYSADAPPKVTLSGGGGRDAEATAVVGPGGVITGFTITNGGGGYASAPSVSIASPGQALVQAILESKPDPVSGRYSVKEFRVTNAGRNYTTAPNIEVAAPYDFTLDGDEIAQFDTAFTQVVIGRIEGQHLFHSPEASLGSGVVLRAPRAGGTLDVAALSATGPVSIVGSGSTFHFDTAAPTISGASISIDDNV
ncbi:MAG: hypothetical protein ACK52B_02625, partial [Gammaproteobacteria bacterium]